MKLFLVIYSAAHIGGTIGPLPYGMDGCERHRDEMRRNLEAFLADGIDRKTGLAASQEQIERAKALRFECEYHNARPTLGKPA